MKTFKTYTDQKSTKQKMTICKEVNMDDEKEVAREQFKEQEIATLEQIKINLLIAVIVKSQYLKVQDMIKTFVYIFQLTAQE